MGPPTEKQQRREQVEQRLQRQSRVSSLEDGEKSEASGEEETEGKQLSSRKQGAEEASEEAKHRERANDMPLLERLLCVGNEPKRLRLHRSPGFGEIGDDLVEAEPCWIK